MINHQDPCDVQTTGTCTCPTNHQGDTMNELTQAQNEALIASANKHEDAAKEIRAITDQLYAAGYVTYAKLLTEVVTQMISHVDHAREIARRK